MRYIEFMKKFLEKLDSTTWLSIFLPVLSAFVGDGAANLYSFESLCVWMLCLSLICGAMTSFSKKEALDQDSNSQALINPINPGSSVSHSKRVFPKKVVLTGAIFCGTQLFLNYSFPDSESVIRSFQLLNPVMISFYGYYFSSSYAPLITGSTAVQNLSENALALSKVLKSSGGQINTFVSRNFPFIAANIVIPGGFLAAEYFLGSNGSYTLCMWTSFHATAAMPKIVSQLQSSGQSFSGAPDRLLLTDGKLKEADSGLRAEPSGGERMQEQAESASSNVRIQPFSDLGRGRPSQPPVGPVPLFWQFLEAMTFPVRMVLFFSYMALRTVFSTLLSSIKFLGYQVNDRNSVLNYERSGAFNLHNTSIPGALESDDSVETKRPESHSINAGPGL